MAKKLQSLVISSQFEEIQQVEGYLAKLKQQLAFGEDDYSRIMLALSEAVTNAIVHGNKEDPDKYVTVSAQVSGSILNLCIHDEGEGFNPDNLPDPLQEENLLNEGGRGVFLIKQYADKTTYSQKGTCLELEFELELCQD